MSIILDVCRALTYLHCHGVIHGDCKAANVMLVDVCEATAADGREEEQQCSPGISSLVAKLADFGQSKAIVLSKIDGKSKSSCGNYGLREEESRTASFEAQVIRNGVEPPSLTESLGGCCEFPPSLTHASPELVSGSPISFSSDIYALGVLLWELTSGGANRPYKK